MPPKIDHGRTSDRLGSFLTGNRVNDSSLIDTQRTLSGRKVVAAMFGFGAVMVGALWLYWEAYTRPFRELQYAIAAEYKGSSPRVIGGRFKSDEHNPETLRIIIWVDFDPNSDEKRSRQYAGRLAELAREHQDLSKYDVLEVHLMQLVPESESHHWTLTRPVKEWLEDDHPANQS